MSEGPLSVVICPLSVVGSVVHLSVVRGRTLDRRQLKRTTATAPLTKGQQTPRRTTDSPPTPPDHPSRP